VEASDLPAGVPYGRAIRKVRMPLAVYGGQRVAVEAWKRGGARVLSAGSREVRFGAIAGVIGIRVEGETASGVAVFGTSLYLS
jgi:hypothetical protein